MLRPNQTYNDTFTFNKLDLDRLDTLASQFSVHVITQTFALV